MIAHKIEISFFILQKFFLLLIFLRSFSVCFGSFWNKSVCFGCFYIHYWFVLVHFETNLFVLVVLKYILNTETNRNKIFFCFENEPKQTRNRSCFGYFWFLSFPFLYSFRGHPSPKFGQCRVNLAKHSCTPLAAVEDGWLWLYFILEKFQIFFLYF